jgi:GNAT superfamily N-acetyltransferase
MDPAAAAATAFLQAFPSSVKGLKALVPHRGYRYPGAPKQVQKWETLRSGKPNLVHGAQVTVIPGTGRTLAQKGVTMDERKRLQNQAVAIAQQHGLHAFADPGLGTFTVYFARQVPAKVAQKARWEPRQLVGGAPTATSGLLLGAGVAAALGAAAWADRRRGSSADYKVQSAPQGVEIQVDPHGLSLSPDETDELWNVFNDAGIVNYFHEERILAVARDSDGDVIGGVTADASEEIALAVQPDWQGSGIGGAMITQLVAQGGGGYMVAGTQAGAGFIRSLPGRFGGFPQQIDAPSWQQQRRMWQQQGWTPPQGSTAFDLDALVQQARAFTPQVLGGMLAQARQHRRPQQRRQQRAGDPANLALLGTSQGLPGAAKRYRAAMLRWPKKPLGTSFTSYGHKLHLKIPSGVRRAFSPTGERMVTDGVVLFPGVPAYVLDFLGHPYGAPGGLTQQEIDRRYNDQLADWVIEHRLGQPGYAAEIPYMFNPVEDAVPIWATAQQPRIPVRLTGVSYCASCTVDAKGGLKAEVEGRQGEPVKYSVDAVRLRAAVDAIGAPVDLHFTPAPGGRQPLFFLVDSSGALRGAMAAIRP